MDSYTKNQFLNHTNHHHNHQQEDHNSGLLRFRSAPSSLFDEFTQTSNDFNKFTAKFGDEICERKPQMVDLEQSNSHFLAPQYPKLSCGLNLNRQNSSPAGFFNQLNTQDGYTIMRGMGNFRVGNGTNVESSPRISRFNMNHLPWIPELANENVKETSTGVKFRNLENDSGFDSSPTGYAFVSWNDSTSDASHLSENDGLANTSVLSRHLSLPKTSSEMAAVEKLLHFQDVVPCKVRAKRGCATHPRSIAERMRRNRISDRMRKLQELVPNMDRQINTSDMLDLAVDYIKILQNQYKVLSDNRAKCKCVK